jgi:hypothetical protein
MFIFMTAEGIPNSDQVEFRIFVPRDRAKLFRAELGELAVSYDGTFLAVDEKTHLSSVPAPEVDGEILSYRKDMATEIYEENSGDRLAIITKEDFKRFGSDQNRHGTATSQAFNTIMRYAKSSSETQSGRPKTPYVARGAWAEPADSFGPPRPTQAEGILVSRIEALARQMTRDEYKIHGFADSSKELLNIFVEALFASNQDTN